MATDRIDEATLLRVYRENLAPLYAFVARRLGGVRALAEDVTQETWLRALAAWRKQGLPVAPLAWLHTTARRLILNHFRDAARRRFEPAAIDFDALAAVPGQETAALIQHGLSRLRAADAALLEAFHFDSKSMRELATELACSERAVEGRLRRAREALERVLRPWRPEEDTLQKGTLR